MPRSSCGSHVESSTTRCSATFAVATTAAPAGQATPGPRPTNRRPRGRGHGSPGPAPIHPCRPARGACAAGPLRAACAPRAGGRVPNAPSRARALHEREGAGKYLFGGVVPEGGRSGRAWAPRRGGVPGHPTRPPMSLDDEPAVRCPARPSNGAHPRRRHPRIGARRAGVGGCDRSRRRQRAPVPWGTRPTRPRDTGTTRHGPICRLRAAVPAVPGEGLGQPGNWPECAATCSRGPWFRCEGSCGCRASCRRRWCWSGRRSR